MYHTQQHAHHHAPLGRASAHARAVRVMREVGVCLRPGSARSACNWEGRSPAYEIHEWFHHLRFKLSYEARPARAAALPLFLTVCDLVFVTVSLCAENLNFGAGQVVGLFWRLLTFVFQLNTQQGVHTTTKFQSNFLCAALRTSWSPNGSSSRSDAGQRGKLARHASLVRL